MGKFTAIQEEKFYYVYLDMPKESINNTLTSFFMELVKRRKDDPFEGGLQASIVIMPNKATFKVCEDDGKAPHMQTMINSIKYMNNDYNFLTREGITYFSLYSKELSQLSEECIEIRVLDGEKELMLAIVSNRDIKSLFQVSLLEKIFAICTSLMENKIYTDIVIGLSTPTEKVDFEPLSSLQLQMLNQSLINERERINIEKENIK